MKNEEKTKKSILHVAFEWIETFSVAFVAVALIFTLIFRIVGVKGPSMQDTLEDGDRIIVSRFLYQPEFGDIVVISHGAQLAEPIVKRVIALENQTVHIDFLTGKVFVDGSLIDEPYIRNETLNSYDVEFPLTVPEGHVFVLGDNRQVSKDSRTNEIGFIDNRDIIGKLMLRVYPMKKLGIVE